MLRVSAVLLLALCGITYGQFLQCNNPYKNVGDKCIYIASFLQADWDEARFFCSQFQGRLLRIDDVHLFIDIIDHLKDNSVDGRSYWLDGTDRVIDGTWTWTDGTEIPLGAPYWAVSGTGNGDYVEEPSDNGRDNHDCLAMDGARSLYYDDADCALIQATICEPVPA